ncbi:MAG: hypothetical protein ACFFC7_18745, partial [Candidatus Hermodarchaeota archaeon]
NLKKINRKLDPLTPKYSPRRPVSRIMFDLKESHDKGVELFPIEEYPAVNCDLIKDLMTQDYAWVSDLKTVTKDNELVPPDNFLLLLGYKSEYPETEGIAIAFLFELTEYNLQLRAVGPTTFLETINIDKTAFFEIFLVMPELWKSKTILTIKSKNEWKLLLGFGETG